jgi:hypothetical protein
MPVQSNIEVSIITTETRGNGRSFVAHEFRPNEATTSGRINAGMSTFPETTRPTPLATPLVRFIQSVTGRSYGLVISVLPGYVFADPEHDLLRFKVGVDGVECAVHTVSARQTAGVGGSQPFFLVVDGPSFARKFFWKEIEIADDDGEELEAHGDWNYQLGTIRVRVERCREEEGEDVGPEGADEDDDNDDEDDDNDDGDDDSDDDNDDDNDVDNDDDGEEEEEEEGEEGEMDVDEEDEEMGMEPESDDDGDDTLTMHRINVEERCLSHCTAQVSQPLPPPPTRAALLLRLLSSPAVSFSLSIYK